MGIFIFMVDFVTIILLDFTRISKIQRYIQNFKIISTKINFKAIFKFSSSAFQLNSILILIEKIFCYF